jgi:hypothetical protein
MSFVFLWLLFQLLLLACVSPKALLFSSARKKEVDVMEIDRDEGHGN